MDVLWKLEPATAAKHRLYRGYLDAWWPIMLQPTASGFLWPRVTYVDAFAGPGRYLDGEDGSPVFVLDRLLHHAALDRMQLRRDRVHLVFIEKDRHRHDHLCRELTLRFGPLGQLPVSVFVRCGDAALETARTLDGLRAWGNPILSIFDSWGNVNIPLSLIRRIGLNKASEAIITFGPNWFSRRQDLNPDQLDTVFGGRAMWTQAEQTTEPEDRWRAWLTTYRHALGRAGFDYRLDFEIVPHTGQPLYLVYGTGHPSGVKAMKDAMWTVDGNDGMSFRDPRTRGGTTPGQLTLWGAAGAPQPELLELVLLRLQDGAVTIADLRNWLLRETARWRETHAVVAVKELKATNQVLVEPEGRIVKTSIVMLR
jgi:three-Cys-motif partner protein